MHALSEAEIQVLIALIELSQPVETPNNNFYRFHPQTIEEAATYFKGFRVDWSEAYDDLAERGLLEPGPEGWVLTAAGLKTAAEVRRARPPIYYWYRAYYTSAPHSPAYRRFCEELYGRFLCQTNFSDMDQLDRLAETLALHPGERALDLGCGTGLIAEYLSDGSGAAFTGIDYCPDAVAQALERTAPKRQRLDFAVQNLDTLDFPEGSFDALVAIDTLYMPNDLDATLRKMAALLRPRRADGHILFHRHLGCGRRARPAAAGAHPAGRGLKTGRPAVHHPGLQPRDAPAPAAQAPDREGAAPRFRGRRAARAVRLHPGRI